MKHGLLFNLILFVLISPVLSVCLAAGDDPCYVPDHLLVRFEKEGMSSADDAARLAVVEAAGGGTIEKMYTVVPGLGLIKLPSGTTVLEAEATFSATPGVRYVARDDIYEFFITPNDPLYPEMWGLNNIGQTGGLFDADIDAPEAWDIGTGTQDIIVAVCDSGVYYEHVDLADNMWTNEAELNGTAGVDDDNNGYIDDIHGYDFPNDDAEPEDNIGHGTHVSGTIGAVGNNNEGVTGVCWNVQIMACKIGDFFISTAAAIEAIQYSIDNGARVMNHSWGGYTYNQALFDAIVASRNAGLLFVAAAGNDAINNDVFPAYPASYNVDNIISVLATGNDDTRALFSNYGPTTVDLGAPGVNIYSTVPDDLYDGAYSGTSMASPHVAGAAALLWSINPDFTYQEVRNTLFESVDPKISLNNLCATEGRLNIFAALSVEAALTPDPMEWEVEPVGVGQTTIYMKAVNAQHPSGVQYYFDCETHPDNFVDEDKRGRKWYGGDTRYDSNDLSDDPNGWVDDPVYYRGDYETGQEYYFRVRARSISDKQETEWSEIIGPVKPETGLAPYPNPAQWEGSPRKVGNGRIAMEAAESYAEAIQLEDGKWVSTPVQYYFECVGTDDPLFIGKPEDLSSENDPTHDPSDRFYMRNVSVIPPSPPGYFYKFELWAVGENDVPTDPVTGTAFMAPPPNVREVPSASYPTIQSAIDSANHGDTVLVHSGVYREINIDFKGKAITVKSENPEDPAIVAATVIDCAEPESIYWGEPRRAFLIQNEEGRDTVLAGITIRNATAFDEPEVNAGFTVWAGNPDRDVPSVNDGVDALGGAILMGSPGHPSSPTIRNCVFASCFAHGEYGSQGGNGPAVGNDQDGNPGERGGHGGNAYGGAIYVYAGGAPLIKECEFINCQAIGGDAGNGGNGSDGGGHSNDVENANGHRGGDGGDAGSGGCAWGGAIYFESNCLPDLYDVTIRDCLVQVGEAGFAGNGANGNNAKGQGRGGHGGNGGVGGDLRAPDSSGGAIYFGDNTKVTIDGCLFENCRVIAQLEGDYSGGDGGNGGDAAGDGWPGGNGGNGGPAFMIPPKMNEIGGVDATGGTGGDGGGGAGGGGQGQGGNGGFRHGAPGNGRPNGADFRGNHTGIFPSNIYYMAYYWEDTMNIYNPPTDPNDHYYFSYVWEWDAVIISETILVPPPDPVLPGEAEIEIEIEDIFDSPFSPYFGFLSTTIKYHTPVYAIFSDPNDPSTFVGYFYDILNATILGTNATVKSLTPTNPNERSAGACAGANFYGRNCVVTMKDTRVIGNNSFANHGGGELYDKGCDATFENCTYDKNQTLYGGGTFELTDYIYEGFGGAIFADQPVQLIFKECEFSENNAYSGGAVYCNFAPSDPNSQLDPTDPDYIIPPRIDLTECTFTGNQANSHFMYSYGGGVYAGNSLDPYEEYYFNYFLHHRYNNFNDYLFFFWMDPVAVDEFITFIVGVYDHYHGYVDFTHPITTQLWNDKVEADHILKPWGDPDKISPVYRVTVEGVEGETTFGENLAPYGSGLYFDASLVDVTESTFTENTGEVGVGGYMFACDAKVQDNIFNLNIGTDIESLGTQSQMDDDTVETFANGAGLYVSNSNLYMTNNRFAANVVDGFGGGLFVNYPSLDFYPQYLINNLFVENAASLQGGAMVASGGSDVSVQNCTFVDNSISDIRYGVGGALLVHDGFADILNSIFWSTEDFYPGAPLGPQIAVGDPFEEVEEYDPNYIPYSTVFVDYSDVQGGEDDIFVSAGEGPWLWYSANNIEDDPATEKVNEADPRFVGISDPYEAVERTLYLAQVDPDGIEPLQEALFGPGEYNPCVDSGLGTSAGLATLIGFDVTTRTDHGIDQDPVDIGFHYDASLPIKEYLLETSVFLADRFPHGVLFVTTDPNTPYKEIDPEESVYWYRYKQGTAVELWAEPEDLEFTEINPDYQVKRWIGADKGYLYHGQKNTITMTGFENVQVEFEIAVPKNLYVPESYDTIEDAIIAARDNDTIILAYQPDEPYLVTNPDGLNFNGKKIRLTSIDPNDPDIVAGTIIDAQGQAPSKPTYFSTGSGFSKRAFHFNHGEDASSTIEGITIRNAFVAEIGASAAIFTDYWPWPFTQTVDPLPPYRALSGEDAKGDNYGGAILIENGSSPLIRNCVFENCTVSGGIGGNGENGWVNLEFELITDDNIDSQSGGHSGYGTGDGYGGAIAIRLGDEDDPDSAPCYPTIIGCTFINNRATGGWGGCPGDAGRPYNAGRYGWGGNDYSGLIYLATTPEYAPLNDWLNAGYGEGDGRGGAIFVAAGCVPEISQCTFEGNIVRPGYVWPGGAESPGGNAYPEPWDDDPWGEVGIRVGRDGYLFDNGRIAGGALYFEEGAEIKLEGCSFIENQAYDVYTHDDPPISTRGGALYSDPNATIEIFPLYDEDLIVSDSNFVGNLGGAIYCSTAVNLEISTTDFIDNVTYIDDPSGIYEPSGSFDIAGAITVEIDPNETSVIDNCQFIGNTSHVGGGAIRTEGDMDLWNCKFYANTSEENGGAFYSYIHIPDPNTKTLLFNFTSCEFNGNTAQEFGGAVYAKTAILDIKNSFLLQNTAQSGGGLRLSWGDLSMHGSVLYGNVATGVISETHRTTAVGEGFGGGIHVTDSSLKIEDTRFEHNQALGKTASGGGLCISGSQDYYQQSLMNCLFADNHSDNAAGGVSCEKRANPDIDICTFANNTSKRNLGGALFIDAWSNATITNSIVSGNEGIGIYETTGSDTDVYYALFYKNDGGDMRNGADGLIYSADAAPGWDSLSIQTEDPLFASGPVGMYYLQQVDPQSPAINAGSDFPYNVGLFDEERIFQYTTDPTDPLDGYVIEDGLFSGKMNLVDLGYHYFIPDSAEDRYELTASVQGGVGTVTPSSGTYYYGVIVNLSADIDEEYYLTGWSGGTFDDASEEHTNQVMITGDKDIKAVVRLRRTLNVGGSGEYDYIMDAIEDAQDGDILLIAPGEYTAASQFPAVVNTVSYENKKITVSGFTPDDEAVVRATILRDLRFILEDLGPDSVLEGVTLEQSRMTLYGSDMLIRNCVFSECRFRPADVIHINPPCGTDGFDGQHLFGGAITMLDSSPQVINCIFEDNFVEASDGEDGFAGCDTHPDGGDGGWPGRAYGGAVYCGFSSEPEFRNCTFVGNEAFGGEGGDGGDGSDPDGGYGGRGGGWEWPDYIEENYFILTIGWDGWDESLNDDKYLNDYYSLFYEMYDWDQWVKWFAWDERFSSWDDFMSHYSVDPYDMHDPYWRYSGYGGAVCCEFDSNATFVDCIFEDNQSYGSLSGIGGDDIFTVVPRPDRQLNLPTIGGAVYAGYDSDVTFDGCVFSNNTADTSTVDLPHTFQVSFGGAVAYEFDCEVTFNDCDFFQNNATVGGGIYGREAMVEIADCNLVDNEAYIGAGFYSDDQRVSIEGALVEANRAKVPDLVVVPPDDDTPDEPEVPAATLDLTGEGGGIYAQVQDLKIRDSMFVNNHSDISGSGLLLSGTVDKQANVFNCLFTENIAGRDGAGASVNWFNKVNFANCTFADNSALGTGEFTSTGGGLYCGTHSVVDVIDSIFWNNSATVGQQITVGSGFEFDPRPSTMTISYSDVSNYPSADAIFVGVGSTLNQPVPGSVFSGNPKFMTLPGAVTGDVTQRYYFNQLTSPCIDAGSDFASDIGLFEYTTSISGDLDKGIVDLGFHYKQAAKSVCRLADLELDGIVSLSDCIAFISEWLTLEACGKSNNWCSRADMNFDTTVDIEDFAILSACWMEYDDESPFPSPAEWELEPNAIPGTFGTIEMKATLHHDLWWPDEDLEYKYDCIVPPGDLYDSGWLSVDDRYFKKSGLAPGAYQYVVRVRDSLGNVTKNSVVRTVIPGENTRLPQTQWFNEPFVRDDMFAIEMQALAYGDYATIGITVPTLPSGYVIKYQFEHVGTAPGGDDRDYLLNPVYVDTGMTEGLTYSYRVRMGLFYEPGDGTSVKIRDGEWSEVVDVVAVIPDLYPPIPDPAQHATGSPFELFVDSKSVYYHVVLAVPATDVINADGDTLEENENIEYKFVCNDSSCSSGGSKDRWYDIDGNEVQGKKWRNIDNVTGFFYANGEPQTPEQYWSKVGLVNQIGKTWYIIVRDRTLNRNATAPSESRTILTPAP